MILYIEIDGLEFSIAELKQQVNALGNLSPIVSRLSMQRLQDLQAGVLKEI
jgi:hypothetical protein